MKKQTIPDWYVAGFSFLGRGGCCAASLLICVGFLQL